MTARSQFRFVQALRTPLAVAAVVLTTTLLFVSSTSAAAKFKTLYTFTGGADGGFPVGGLARDTAGNLYGIANTGGSYGYGAVFKVSTTGRETVLYSFRGTPDGQYPSGGVVRDAAGNLYGVTFAGGASRNGTVFKLSKTGEETILYSFTGKNLASPEGSLVLDAQGNLYGTTVGDCFSYAYYPGAAFKLAPDGTLTVLHAFNGLDGGGECPYAGLIRGAEGNLYGTTQFGCGIGGYSVVFQLDANGKETALHCFAPREGGYIFAGLVRDRAGNLYGAAEGYGAYGAGTVFKLDRFHNLTVLYSFTGGTDGKGPFAGVVLDRVGNVYGTTFLGGRSKYGTDGVVFKLDKNGKETVLHSFMGPDGSNPEGTLIRDAAGNLYGTATGFSSVGTVFMITP